MMDHGRIFKACNFFLLIVLLASGCDKLTKRKILVFVFPPLAKEKKSVTETVETTKPSSMTKKSVSPPPAYFVHGPKAQGECNQCHESSGSYAFRKLDATGTSALSSGRSVSGRLVQPVSLLCVDCHASKSQKVVYGDHLWLHGPVAQGECTLCHQPHQSEFRYLLLKNRSVELCGSCHTKGYISENEEHTKGEECISCHNPHAGKNHLLLKKDYKEAY